MNIYCLKFIVEPLPENENFGRIKKAVADVWVKSETYDAAIAKALSFFQQYSYSVLETDPAFSVSTVQQMLEKGKSLLPEVVHALDFGIGCHLTGATDG